MPEEVLTDGLAIGARSVGTHAVLVEILGKLDVQTVRAGQSVLAQATATTRDTSSSTSPVCDSWPRPRSRY